MLGWNLVLGQSISQIPPDEQPLFLTSWTLSLNKYPERNKELHQYTVLIWVKILRVGWNNYMVVPGCCYIQNLRHGRSHRATSKVSINKQPLTALQNVDHASWNKYYVHVSFSIIDWRSKQIVSMIIRLRNECVWWIVQNIRQFLHCLWHLWWKILQPNSSQGMSQAINCYFSSDLNRKPETFKKRSLISEYNRMENP